MNDKAFPLLGMAMRAGKLAAGFNRCETAVKSGRAALVLICSDISAKTAKEMHFLCDKHGCPVCETDFTGFQLSAAIGTKCGVCAMTDPNFANRLKDILNCYGKDDTTYDDKIQST